MLYLFSGDDAKNKILSYEEFIKSVPKDTEIFKFSRNDFNQDQIESFYSGPGLFSRKSLIVFHNFFEDEEIRDFILEKMPLMAEAENSFVFLEGKLNKTILDAFKKARAELNIFELAKNGTEKFNSFLLANAFGVKDKLNLWVYFRQAVERGVPMEELVGVLFWKIKEMILKKNFSKFSEKELKNLAAKLSYLLPETRQQGLEAEVALEQFLLEAF